MIRTAPLGLSPRACPPEDWEPQCADCGRLRIECGTLDACGLCAACADLAECVDCGRWQDVIVGDRYYCAECAADLQRARAS